MAKKKASPPRPYGRQGEDKTIKSLSLEKEVVAWVDAEAQRRGMSFSAFINEFLKGTLNQHPTSKKRAAGGK